MSGPTQDDTSNAGAKTSAESEEIDAALDDVPIVESLPEAVSNFKGFRQREVKSLRRYREKLKEQIAEVKGLLGERELILQRLSDQTDAAESAASSAQAYCNGAADSQSQVEMLMAQAKASLENADELQPKLDVLVEQCAQIEARAQTAAERSQHIEDGFQYVQRTRPDVETAATGVAKLHADAKVLADEAVQREARLDAIEEAATEVLETAAGHSKSVALLVEEFSERNNQVSTCEEQLRSLIDQASLLTGRVDSLLPGATSAGLASSFSSRATELNGEIRFWHGISLASLVGLAVYALYYGDALIEGVAVGDQWIESFVPVVLKGLVALPLVWLALAAGTRGTLAKRVREDYRYKAALATAFEGFKNQLADIDAEGEAPVVELSRNVLDSLAAQPGRLYDAKHQEVTPLSAAADVVARATAGRRAKIRGPVAEAEFDGKA